MASVFGLVDIEHEQWKYRDLLICLYIYDEYLDFKNVVNANICLNDSCYRNRYLKDSFKCLYQRFM